MCGRFLLEPRTPQAVRQFFDLDEELGIEPRWNIAPTQVASVVRRNAAGRPEIARLRWGLIPSWSKDASGAARCINARSETAAEKPSFRAAWKARHCVVPATGWYEWQTGGERKQPWLLSLAAGEFTAFAGLWERWIPNGSEPVESFTILTRPAVSSLSDVHERMPVVLTKEWIAPWLSNHDRASDTAIPSELECADWSWRRQPVSTRVNSPKHDDADCVLPLTPPSGGRWVHWTGSSSATPSAGS